MAPLPPLSLLYFCSLFSLSPVDGFMGRLVYGYQRGLKCFVSRFVGTIGLWVSVWFVGIDVVVLWVLVWLCVGFGVVVLWFMGISMGQFV